MSIPVDKSITLQYGNIVLKGDEKNPTPLFYYGTDATGKKGFHMLPTGGGTGDVEEAPIDGQKYGRINEGWSVITEGVNGADGADGIDGINGTNGTNGIDGVDGNDGATGAAGADGTNGTDGIDGTDGDSAYEVAVNEGYVGSEAAWLLSLVGAQGDPGNDGADGSDGTNGTDGIDGTNGVGVPAGGTTGQVLEKIDSTDYNTQWATPSGGGGTPTSTEIFEGTKTASQNINGVEGTQTVLTWDAATNDASEITSFTSGDDNIVFTNAGWVNIHVSAYILDGTVNNRSCYGLTLKHFNTGGTQLYGYWGDMQYNRDDATTYDASGGYVSNSMMYVAAGDYIEIRTHVFEDGTSGSTQYLDTSYSKIRIIKIGF